MSTVKGGLKKSTISAVVLNADGTVKRDLGIVSYFHKNLIKRVIGGAWVSYWSGRRIRQYNKENHVFSSDDAGRSPAQ